LIKFHITSSIWGPEIYSSDQGQWRQNF